jgi:hypothetical protein
MEDPGVGVVREILHGGGTKQSGWLSLLYPDNIDTVPPPSYRLRRRSEAMDVQARKAAVRAYKEREVPAGIFRILCTATARQWVGRAPDLGTIRNRHWSSLRFGGCPIRTLQAEWAAHGEAAFLFEELERLPADTAAMAIPRLLKARHEHWVDALAAESI